MKTKQEIQRRTLAAALIVTGCAIIAAKYFLMFTAIVLIVAGAVIYLKDNK